MLIAYCIIKWNNRIMFSLPLKSSYEYAGNLHVLQEEISIISANRINIERNRRFILLKVVGYFIQNGYLI